MKLPAILKFQNQQIGLLVDEKPTLNKTEQVFVLVVGNVSESSSIKSSKSSITKGLVIEIECSTPQFFEQVKKTYAQ